MSRIAFRIVTVLIVLLAAVGSVCCQSFNLDKDRLPVVELKGQFRFQTGDDPDGKLDWADPAFDDSGWPLLRSDKSWYDQGYKNYGGVAWYRFRVTAPEGQNDLAIYIPIIQDSYAVYSNARLIGQIGEFPPHSRIMIAPNEMFLIPRGLIVSGQPLVMAVRVWRSPRFAMFSGGGFISAPYVGDATAIAQWRDLQIHERFWSLAGQEIMLVVNVLSALFGLALFLLRRSEREYFWWFAAQILWSFYSIGLCAPLFLRISFVTEYGMYALGGCGGAFLNLIFFHVLLQQRKRLMFWLGSVPVLLLSAMACAALAGWVSFPLLYHAAPLCFVLYTVAVALLIYRSGRKGNTEAWLLVVPFTLSALSIVYFFVFNAFDLARYPALDAFNQQVLHLVTWPVHMDYIAIVGLACISSVCVVLILRFARSRRDEERLFAELEAARIVQQVLIPDKVISVPGYQIQSVYTPAGQVGGDFFQILPTAHGGVLAVIGDVSGKGLPAAMTVSLLVGTARALSRSSDAPGPILEAMNEEMLGRSHGGFTTCLVVRANSDGRLTMANAGHVAPYIDGREIELDGGLPLGITDGYSNYLVPRSSWKIRKPEILEQVEVR